MQMHLKLTVWDEATHPDWAICPLEYGDYTGLTDSEIEALERYKASLPAGCALEYLDGEYFSWSNAITGRALGGMVRDCVIYYFTEGD